NQHVLRPYRKRWPWFYPLGNLHPIFSSTDLSRVRAFARDASFPTPIPLRHCIWPHQPQSPCVRCLWCEIPQKPCSSATASARVHPSVIRVQCHSPQCSVLQEPFPPFRGKYGPYLHKNPVESL